MENIIIVLITLSFGFIVFNIMNNKKFSLISFMLLILICIFYFIKIQYNDIFIEITSIIKNVDLSVVIYSSLIFIVSLIEYIIGYKKTKKTIKVEQEQIIENDENTTKKQIDFLVVYLELFDEPLACLINDEYIINNKMRKLLKFDSYIVDRKKLYSLVYNPDKVSFLSGDGTSNLRINVNGEYEWFEFYTTTIDNNKYCLIKKCDRKSDKLKVKLKTFKELISILEEYKEKDYYLVFFDIINYSDLISFYGTDLANIVLHRQLLNILDLQYVKENNIFYVSKNEYIILIDNTMEYNILLSELENNSSIFTKNDIIISDNKITVKGKVGTVASCNVNNKNASNVISKGLEMVKLACDEDYQLDYAIYHEIDEQIDYSLKDLNIDLEFDFTKYKQRIQ